MNSIVVSKKYNNKCVDKLLTVPPLCTITMNDLLSALKTMGFIVESINGSHYKFSHPACPEVVIPVVPKPHGGKKEVKRGYIRNIQESIIEINDRRENTI